MESIAPLRDPRHDRRSDVRPRPRRHVRAAHATGRRRCPGAAGPRERFPQTPDAPAVKTAGSRATHTPASTRHGRDPGSRSPGGRHRRRRHRCARDRLRAESRRVPDGRRRLPRPSPLRPARRAAPELTDVVAAVRDSVVTITSEGFSSRGFAQIPSTGVGSGVILTADGYILTNKHVVTGSESLIGRARGRPAVSGDDRQ